MGDEPKQDGRLGAETVLSEERNRDNLEEEEPRASRTSMTTR